MQRVKSAHPVRSLKMLGAAFDYKISSVSKRKQQIKQDGSGASMRTTCAPFCLTYVQAQIVSKITQINDLKSKRADMYDYSFDIIGVMRVKSP